MGWLRFKLSGYSRPDLDVDLMCGECMCKWSYGDWFPRWCRFCRRAAAFDADTGRQVRTLRRDLRLATDDRDRWIRLFNRLEAAVSHHKKALGYEHDDLFEPWDEALYKARDKILKDAARSDDRAIADPAPSAPAERPGDAPGNSARTTGYGRDAT